MKNLLLTICLVFGLSILYAQSPANLTTNIAASNGFSTVLNTEASYNNARRQEEMQLGLTANAIQDLDLPSQAVWDGLSADAKTLYLLNDERTARAGIDYGNGAVKGLAFEGVESNMDGVAQNFADLLRTNNAFDHCYPGAGDCPSKRIDDDNVIGGTGCSNFTGTLANCCHQHIPRSENLSATSVINDPTAPESFIYGFNYTDGPSWGHREMDLLQDDDLAGGAAWGFTNDHGAATQEGLVGVGISSGAGTTWGTIMVLNYFDPVDDASAGGCNYNITVSTNSLPSGDGGGGGGGAVDCHANVTIMSATISGDTAASATIMTNNTVVVNGTTTFSAPTVTLNSGFSAPAGQIFTANTTGCTATPTADGTCSAPFVITCGQVYSGNNITNGINTWDTYDNSPDYTGKEVIHTLTIAAGSIVNLDLTNNTQDLALFIYTACDNLNTSFLTTSDNVGPTAAESVTIPSSPSSRTVYVIVDGWMNAASNYNLSCTTSFTSDEIAISRNGKANITENSTLPIREIRREVITKMGTPIVSTLASPQLLEQVGGMADLVVYPNPFNASTTIQYHLPEEGVISLYLTDITGKQIAALIEGQSFEKGLHQFRLDGKDLANGMYYLTMKANHQLLTKKLMVNH